MAEFNPIFEVDAGKILAKLHLAGQQQATNATVLNSAIENPTDSPNPEKPGETTFNLDKGTDFQIASVVNFQYYLTINIDEKGTLPDDKILSEFYKVMLPLTAYADVKPEENKSDEEAGKSEDKKAADKEAENAKKPLTAPAKESYIFKKNGFLKFLLEADDKKAEEKKKLAVDIFKKVKPDKILALMSEYLTKFTYVKDKVKEFKTDDKAIKEADKDDDKKVAVIDSLLTDYNMFVKAIQEENKQRLDNAQKTKDELRKGSVDGLLKYFLNFAGKDNSAKIRDGDIVLMNVSVEAKEGETAKVTDFEDTVKDGKFMVDDIDKLIKDKENKIRLGFPKKGLNEFCGNFIACVVGYTVDVK